MERIQVYKRSRILSFAVRAFAVLYIVLGVGGLIKMYFTTGESGFLDGHISFLGYIVQGIIFGALSYSTIKREHYFIEWDDNQIRYFLTHDKQVVTIPISNIRSVSIQLYEIILQLTDTEKTLHIELIQYKDIKRIKEKFEEIKEHIDAKQPSAAMS